MTLFTKAQHAQLIKNGHPKNSGKDHIPVVKLILPGTRAVFLITELVNEQPDMAFGLCDLGLGCPELGYMSLDELNELKVSDGCEIKCDPNFEPHHPLSVYTKAAQRLNAITTAEEDLQGQICFLF